MPKVDSKPAGVVFDEVKDHISPIWGEGSQQVAELDAWQEADLLIRQHGEKAELEAARLAELDA